MNNLRPKITPDPRYFQSSYLAAVVYDPVAGVYVLIARRQHQ